MFDYINLPKITVAKIEDLPNGDVRVTFDYDHLFGEFAKKELNLDRVATEEEISQFIYDMLINSLEKKDGWNIAPKNSELKDVN